MESLYPYDSEPDKFINSQADPLVDNIKVELVEIKTENTDEDFCDLNFENIVIEDGIRPLSSHDEDEEIGFEKRRKSQRSRKVEKYKENSDSEVEKKRKTNKKSKKRQKIDDSDLEIKKKKKVKKKAHKKNDKKGEILTEDIISRKKNRKRKKRGNKYSTQDEQTLPEVRNAVYRTFLSADEGTLTGVKFKNIELTRLGNTKGYSVKDEDLDKFKKEQDGKMLYQCEDCNYTGLYRSAFMVHFIAHANLYLIMDALNKTLKANYCYICDVGCQNASLLEQHVKKHQDEEPMTANVNYTKKTRGRKPKAISKDEDGPPALESAEEKPKTPSPKSSPRSFNGNYEDDNVYAEDFSSVFEESGVQISDEEDNKKLSEIIGNKIKVEVEYDTKTEAEDENKMEVVIKEESGTPAPAAEINGGDSTKQCYIKLESVAVRNEILELKREDDKGFVKCETCQFETGVGRLLKHKCKDTRRCDMCDKVLLNQRMFKYHRKLHFCDKCPFKSATTNAVTEHRKNSVDCWHKCTKCSFKTLNIESYYRHMRRKLCPDERKSKMERTQEVMKCDDCGYKTYYKEVLAKHFQQHEALKRGELSLVCNLCGKVCFNKGSMLSHYKSHYCSNCSFASVNRSEVMQHRKNNPECLYKCKNCDFRAVHIVTMRRHKKFGCDKTKTPKYKRKIVNKSFYCDTCQYRTSSKTYLEDHIKKHIDPKPFKCSLCDFKCSQKGNLVVHEKTHIDGKSYCCNICNFQCSHYSKFRAHKKVHGLDENDSKPHDPETKDPRFLYCDRCEFRTKYPQYLKNHKLKHDNIRPYLCHLCGNSYFSLIDYHVHKNQAHTSKPQKLYKCSYCDYSYTKKATVKIHERKHTGTKPHSCEFCTYSTSYSGNLYAHRKKHLIAQGTAFNV